MSEKKSEMSDRGFLFITIALGAMIIWLKHKIQIVTFIVNWRIAVALIITFIFLGMWLLIRRKLKTKNRDRDLENDVVTPIEGEDAVFSGLSEKGKSIYVKQQYRKMHTQVVGTTNAGKTESVILPWAIDDIRKGRGLLIIDGKGSSSG